MEQSMHAAMGHEMMGHGGSGDGMDHSMPGMDHGDMCNMNMIFNWDIDNLCIVFKWWHIRTTAGLIISLLAIVALGAGYEYFRYISRKYESQSELRVTTGESTYSTINNSPSSDITGARRNKIKRAAIYALQVAYSFFLMQVFILSI